MLTFKNSLDHSINREHIGSIENEYKDMEIMNKNILKYQCTSRRSNMRIICRLKAVLEETNSKEIFF